MFDMDKLLGILVDEDVEAVKSMLDTMNDDDKIYMYGYLQGFTDALKMVSESEHDMSGFHIASNSDRIAT